MKTLINLARPTLIPEFKKSTAISDKSPSPSIKKRFSQPISRSEPALSSKDEPNIAASTKTKDESSISNSMPPTTEKLPLPAITDLPSPQKPKQNPIEETKKASTLEKSANKNDESQRTKPAEVDDDDAHPAEENKTGLVIRKRKKISAREKAVILIVKFS